MKDYNLQRFLDAQESSGFGSYKQAINEIQKGKKLSVSQIWMLTLQISLRSDRNVL